MTRSAASAKRRPYAPRGDPQSDVADYIEFQALGKAILDAHDKQDVEHLLNPRGAYKHPGEPSRSVVILDEIDKASRDFPNDLLREVEDLAFRVPELSRRGSDRADPETPGGIPADKRPIVVVTSNEERQLPDAFLRRCVFHEIAFPDDTTLSKIVASGLRKRLPSKNPEDPERSDRLRSAIRRRPGPPEAAGGISRPAPRQAAGHFRGDRCCCAACLSAQPAFAAACRTAAADRACTGQAAQRPQSAGGSD